MESTRQMQPIEAILIGAGQRGSEAFGAFAQRNPHELKFVAVAEPDVERRELFAKTHSIPPERQFNTWEELAEQPRLAPLAINATLDHEHLRSSLPFLAAGYHLLLEKPMARTKDECVAIQQAAREANVMVQVCHPLRFTPFYLKVKELLEDNAIGRVLTMSLAENVGFWHFAHSFVRGNWGRTETSGPLILTKCCHDMDLATWLAGSKAHRISSMGRLAFFREENAPAGAAKRCLDDCPAANDCSFYAPALYLSENTEWPASVISVDKSFDARKRALEQGPYGRCVFQCDNTAVDEQCVTAEFENGILLDFVVRSSSVRACRTIRINGTKGELNGHFEDNEISVTPLAQGMGENAETTLYKIEPFPGGHGGGDEGAIKNFIRCYREEDWDSINTSLDLAVDGHLLAFAAEDARVSGDTIVS